MKPIAYIAENDRSADCTFYRKAVWMGLNYFFSRLEGQTKD